QEFVGTIERNEMTPAAHPDKILIWGRDLIEELFGRPTRRVVVGIALDEDHRDRKRETQRDDVALEHGALSSAQIFCGEGHAFTPVVPVQQREIRHERGWDGTRQLDALDGG